MRRIQCPTRIARTCSSHMKLGKDFFESVAIKRLLMSGPVELMGKASDVKLEVKSLLCWLKRHGQLVYWRNSSSRVFRQ